MLFLLYNYSYLYNTMYIYHCVKVAELGRLSMVSDCGADVERL